MVAKTEHSLRSDCPVACALDIVGDHWTLLIIHFMIFLNMHEYKDFLERSERISTNILSDRLIKLEKYKIISSIEYPENKRRKLYYLTPKGKDLIHVLIELIKWSDKYLNEVVISDEKRNLLHHHPDIFISQALEILSKWESDHKILI